MFRLWKSGTNQVLVGLALAAFAVPVWAANPGQVGAINYVEGQVDLGGQVLSPQSVGSTVMTNGDVLETQQGKAEVLLTPGVFVRVGSDSAIRLDSGGLTDTRLAVLRGEAMVEVTDLFKQNSIQVADNGAVTTIEKRGLYDFNATSPRVYVFKGEAQVRQGDKELTVKEGKDVSLGPNFQRAKFDRKADHDDLYNWSYLRSEYLAQASAASAQTYIVEPGGWYGTGWYWNPWFGAYSFLPGDGILYSPFGWGFFSPGFAYYAPAYGYGYRGGFRGGLRGAPAARTFGNSGVAASRGFAAGGGGFRGGFGGGGFHGGFGGRR